MKNKTKFFIASMIFFLLLISIGFYALTQINQFPVNIDFEQVVIGDLGKKQNDYTITITNAKQWTSPTGMVGAQYDGYIYNNSPSNCDNWTMRITVPDKSYIDSSWDGNFTLDGNTIIITPLDYNASIEAGNGRKFGLVLYTIGTLVNVNVSLSGVTIFNMYKSVPFYLLLFLSFVWIVVIISRIVLAVQAIHYKRQRSRDQQIITQSISTFINFIDAKDPYTRGHSKRVATYSKEIGRRLGLNNEELNNLYYIALMHDAGKVSIPDAILNKKGPLTPEERKIIMTHTNIGGEMLKSFTSIEGIRDGALYHHERYDGTGYPSQLAGNDIPPYARIICIADSYDAMSTNRCYRDKLSKETIISELRKNSGTQFDPALVPYMLDMINDGFMDSMEAYL